MGAIQVGDELFDEAGNVCRVSAKFSPPIEQAYELTFSDGSTLVADAGHQWVTWTHAERKAFLRSPYEDTSRFPDDWSNWRLRRRADIHPAVGPRIRTTEDIRKTLTCGKRGDTNHCIPNCLPLQLPEADLPIPPYTLGAWLGDGSICCGTMTAHADDMPFTRAQIEAEGFVTTGSQSAKGQSFGILGLLPLLKSHLGYKVKKVPADYLRASVEQRLALLRGLMDTDGNIENGNTVAFVNTNKDLIDAVRELVHSLGMKTKLRSGIGRCNGEDKKQYWLVQFTPTVNPFTLPRKADRIVLGGGQSLRNHHRMIVKIEAVDDRPMSCITVDSSSSMYLAGDAFIPTHNTRTGAEWVRDLACGSTPLSGGKHSHIAIIAETAKDARDVMIGDGKLPGEGSGLLQVHPKDFMPLYEPSKRRLTWPNGCVASIYNGSEPDQLRGPAHGAAWCDELAKWQFAQDSWDQLQFGLRSGQNPQVLVSTTPRPIKLIKDIIKDPFTVITRGSTLENSNNLAKQFVETIKRKYEGTRLGRQEIYAEVLDDVPGAMWSRDNLDLLRIRNPLHCPQLKRIVVAIDPAVTSGEDADETGIIVAGIDYQGHGYILEDGSGVMSPNEWASVAVKMYVGRGADRVIGETNNGGDMIENTLRAVDPNIAYRGVHASRGKAIRAEPISALYEQGRVHHVGDFPKLEDQMCAFTQDFNRSTAGYSPDRLDAMVWALTELMLGDVQSKLFFA